MLQSVDVKEGTRYRSCVSLCSLYRSDNAEIASAIPRVSATVITVAVACMCDTIAACATGINQLAGATTQPVG